VHRSHTPSPERGGLSRPSLLATLPNATPTLSEAPTGGASKMSVPPSGIVVTRKEGDGDDDGNEEVNIRTPIRPSAKALGKRRVIEVEEPDRKLGILVTGKLNY
jgi:hypothetical protein